MKITKQGEILLDNKLYHSLIEHDDVVTFSISMDSKNCKVGAHIYDNEVPGLVLCANEETLYLNEKKKGVATIVMFTKFKGKTIRSVSSHRYTVNVTLVKA